MPATVVAEVEIPRCSFCDELFLQLLEETMRFVVRIGRGGWQSALVLPPCRTERNAGPEIIAQ